MSEGRLRSRCSLFVAFFLSRKKLIGFRSFFIIYLVFFLLLLGPVLYLQRSAEKTMKNNKQQKLSYRQQIARQLRAQYAEGAIASVQTFTFTFFTRVPRVHQTAATPLRTLPVVSDFDLPAATIFSYHDIIAARSAVGRSPSLVRWPGMRCLTTSETRRSVPTISGRS